MAGSKRSLQGGEASRLAKRLKVVEKRVRNNTPEKKYAHVTVTTSMAANTAITTHLTGLDQGVGTNQRVGNRIKIQSIEVWGATQNPMGMYLFRVKDTGDSPVAADWINTTTMAPFMDEQNAHVYKHEITGKLYELATAQYPFHLKHTFKGGLITEFNAASANIADVVRGQLFFGLLNHYGTVQSVNYSTKIVYTDA